MAKKIRENRKKTSLAEGFLDGEEDVSVTPEDTQPEVDGDSDDEIEQEDAPVEDDDRDISDDPADDEPVEDNELEDEHSDEQSSDETEDDGVAKDAEEKNIDLQDTMQSLIAAVQALTDQINKQKDDSTGKDAESADDTVESEADANDDFSDDDYDSDAEGEENDETEDDSDAEYEGDDAEETDDTEEETSDESSDETKSEAWNHYAKFGRLLNEKSGSLIGMVQHNRFDMLEPYIMAVVESKIHERVEGAKKEFRMKAFNRKYSES